MFNTLFKLNSDYFNSAYQGPLPLRSQAAVQDLLERSLDPSQLGAEFDLDEELRQSWARLIGCDPFHVTVSTSVSELVSHIANGLTLTTEDEVVLMQGEYPSMVLPWLLHAELKGFQLRFIDQSDFLNPARFAQQLRPRTRFAACSHVMFNTGTQLPIAELGLAARKAGVLFLADTSQSFGGMPLTREILDHVDILVGVGYKWLLGPYGCAYGYFSNEALQRIQRTHASWLTVPGARSRQNLLNYTTECVPGARKFDRGESASYLICTSMKSALDLLFEIGLDKIARHNRELTSTFLKNIPAEFEVVGDPTRISNIVCLRHAQASDLRQKLAQQKIEVSLREGTLRFAFHLFNDLRQIERLLAAL